MSNVPVVFESVGSNERGYDIYSRLLKERIIFLTDTIDDEIAMDVVAQMLFLDSQDRKTPITLYINSPGGSCSAGLAIYDTMQFVKPNIHTICIGRAASMGAVLLAAGDKRMALPHSEIMIHQPSGAFGGTASDILIRADKIKNVREVLINILAKHTKKKEKDLEKDMDRDYWMTSHEAKDYGIIDNVIKI